MRVLHLVKTSVGATWAFRQMRELVKFGIEVHVTIPTQGGIEELYRQAGIHVHIVGVEFSARNPLKTLSAIRNLRKLVQSVEPDIIHSHFVSTTLTMRLGLRDVHIPRIFQVPGPLHLEHIFFKFSEIATNTKDDFWIASCHWTQNTYLQSGIAQNRVYLSFYGGDLPEELPQKGTLRRELGVDEKVLLVGMVAYMYAPKRYLGQTRGIKGHEDLIDALAICRNRGLSVKGVFVGGAWGNTQWYEKKVKDYAAKMLGNDAIFLGTRKDVTNLYVDFNVAVHPSHSENLGGAAESLALAVPTIATQVGGFPDIVITGKTGWLVPPKNPSALAETIITVLSNRESVETTASEGRELAQKELSVTQTSQQVFDIYHHILDGLSLEN